MLPARGRPAKNPIIMSVDRELTPEDLEAESLMGEAKKVISAPPIQRLRASHHAAARLLASGRSIIETAQAVGRTPQRISDLQKDPTFSSLVTYYSLQITETSLDDAQEFAALNKDIARLSAEEIQRRLDDETIIKDIPIGELRQLQIMGMDRTVAPAKSSNSVIQTPTKITLNISGLNSAERETNLLIIEEKINVLENRPPSSPGDENDPPDS